MPHGAKWRSRRSPLVSRVLIIWLLQQRPARAGASPRTPAFLTALDRDCPLLGPIAGATGPKPDSRGFAAASFRFALAGPATNRSIPGRRRWRERPRPLPRWLTEFPGHRRRGSARGPEVTQCRRSRSIWRNELILIPPLAKQLKINYLPQ